jgi:voltage-gated potassium channel
MAQVLPIQNNGRNGEIRPYELFMLMLCAYSLVALAVETFLHPGPNEVEILDAIDNLVCGIFLIDFLICLTRATNKWEYLSWGWIDLLSSIPVVGELRAGRLVRVIRILRVLRGIRLARVMAQYLQRHRADGAFLAVIFLSILILLLASVAILQVEQGEGRNIQTAEDALWWAIVTMTTVGYGDKFPVTTAGRLIASCLMVSGVGLFGALSGSVTSWILNPVEERQEIDLEAIHGELAAIHSRLDNVISRETVSLNPDLARLVEAWPHLPEETRKELERLVTKPD